MSQYMRFQAERLQRGVEAARQCRGERGGSAWEARGVVVVGLAGGEDQTLDARIPALGNQELRPAPVIEHQCHLVQVEALEELDE